MRHRFIDRDSVRFAAAARRGLSALRGDMNRLHDSVSGLGRGIRLPTAPVKRVIAKRTTSGLGASVGKELTSIGRFYTSPAQAAAQSLISLATGQRIR